DGQHRAEDLLLRDAHVVAHVGKQGGLDIEATRQVRRSAAAADQARTFALADLDVLEYACALALADEGTHDLAGSVRLSVPELSESGTKDFDAFRIALPG